MAIPFSRTMRSLDADDFRGPRIVWVLAAILIAGWAWWFFTSQIPVSGAVPQTGAVERTSPARLMWRTVTSIPHSNPSQDPPKQ